MGTTDWQEGSKSKMKTMNQKQELLEILKRTPIVQTACQKVGVSRASFYRWRQQSKTFTKQSDKALADGLELINDMAESQLLTAIRNQNLSAIQFWLKNHHQTYADKLRVMAEVEYKESPLTSAQRALIKKALSLAGVYKPKLKGDRNVKSRRNSNNK